MGDYVNENINKVSSQMGFTWIHLNQVNVGTNVAVGCASIDGGAH